MTTTKELKLVFKNADGKHKNLVIAKPAENLDEATVKGAMQKIVNTHAFEKAGIFRENCPVVIGEPNVPQTMLEQAEKFLKEYSEDEKALLIFVFLNGEIAGSIGLRGVSNMMKLKHRANFGVMVRKKYWNLGIGNLLIPFSDESFILLVNLLIYLSICSTAFFF